MLAPRRFEKARARGLLPHGFGRLFERNENADSRVFAFNRAAQISDLRRGDVTGLHRKNDLPRLITWRAVAEVQSPINPAVSAFLLLDRTSANQAERPPLELIGIGPSQLGRV